MRELEVSSLKQDTVRDAKKREMAEKVTRWVKLTRLGTASRQTHPSKTANSNTYVFTAFLSPPSSFGRLYSVDFFHNLAKGHQLQVHNKLKNINHSLFI